MRYYHYGKAKELESLGATTKVQAKAFTYSSEETRWIDPPGPIRLLGLTVSGLDEEVPMQDSLFESPQDETEDKLASVLDSLESKFGETVIMSGALWQRFHGDNGTRRKRSELKSAVDARGDAPSNTVDDIPSNTADDTSANVDAETTEKKEPKKF